MILRLMYILLPLPFYLDVIITIIKEAIEQEQLRRKFAKNRKKFHGKISSVEIRVIVLEVIAWIAATFFICMFLLQIILFLFFM